MGADARSIRDRVEASLSSLSSKQRLVADFILANPTTILFASVVEVAEHSQVDPATVVRLAKRLGFSGFPELREQLRNEYALPIHQPKDLLKINQSVTDADPGSMYQRVREQTMYNVERTLEQVSISALEEAIEFVLTARRVIVIGAGLSRGPSIHLARVLQSAQVPVHLLEDWYDLLFEAASIIEVDVLFAVTAQRYSTVSIEALKAAKGAGAKTIMLTDATFAPGIKMADVALFFSPKSLAEFYSPVGASIVIDCLAAGLALRVPDIMRESLEKHVELAMNHDLSYW